MNDDIPVLEVEPVGLSSWETAAQLLDRAVQAGAQAPEVHYMLALAHKRQGKIAEARAALRKITKPDANVILQMGLLSLREGQTAQAEQEFARAWQMNSASYAAAYNLLLARLTLGQTQSCLELIGAARTAVPDAGQQRFLDILQEILEHHRPDRPGDERPLAILALDSSVESMTPVEEQTLVKLFRGLGNLEMAYGLLRTFAHLRPQSPAILEAHYECALARGRDLMCRSRWTETVWLLEPMTRERGSRQHQATLHNLLGCCAFVTQDFEKAVRHFYQTVKMIGSDPRMRQNLALALEKNGELSDAEEHWGRFLDLLGGTMMPSPEDVPRYLEGLEFESLLHLANGFSAKEKWSTVLNYLNRAHRLRPDDPDVLERLFHTHNYAKQPNQARKILNRLRETRPNDPQLDLFEIDMAEVKNLADIERMLTEIERVLHRYPDDHRVEDRAVSMVSNVIPLMGNLCDQLTEQLNKVMNQVGNLPRYQVDWGALKEIMRDLAKEFQKLRRITGKCLPLVTSDEHKRIVHELTEHIDKKIAECRSLGV